MLIHHDVPHCLAGAEAVPEDAHEWPAEFRHPHIRTRLGHCGRRPEVETNVAEHVPLGGKLSYLPGVLA